tara:strand:+ start:6704 stop:7939 length:1236 start_codon:yes stop_codon:yes gene_type:complete
MVRMNKKMVGIEEECIIYSSDYRRIPVNVCDQFSASDLVLYMNDNSKDNGVYTLEPGGQLEWSSPPFRNLNNLQKSYNKHQALLELISKKHGLHIIYFGVEPQYDPDDIDLINQLKYQLMNNNMEKNGQLGKWMMRNTSSIQVNYDISSEKDLEEMVFIADCLHPICAYLFSNSPFKNKKLTGLKNIRNIIWENTDKSRSGNLMDHGIKSPQNLLDSYIKYIMNVPGIFQLNTNGNIEDTNQTLGQRLNELNNLGILKTDDIQAALHQIFTNVRLKNLVEIRGADRPPKGYEMAPVAFWTGLLTEKSVREEILSIIIKWSISDRNKLNKAANSLDSSQTGPDDRSYGYWNKWIGEMAIKGLNLRGYNESHLFKNYFNIVLKNGPLGIQTQNAFKVCDKTFNHFIIKPEICI